MMRWTHRQAVIIRLLLIVVIVLPLTAFASTRSQEKNWQERINEITNSTNMTAEEKCQAEWNTVWPIAKAGDLKALDYVGAKLSFGEFSVPGSLTDALSMNRSFVAFYLYSRGPTAAANNIVSRPFGSMYEQLVDWIPAALLNKKLIDCLKNIGTSECTTIAIEDKLIPTLQEFAEEIDRHLATGKPVKCMPPPNPYPLYQATPYVKVEPLPHKE